MASNTVSILIKAQDEASKTFQGAATNVDKASEQIKSASKIAAVATLAAATAIGIDAVKAAGEYESSLSKLQQASGATAEEMNQLSNQARILGQSNDLAGVSAADAAATMTELAKAGLSVKDTLAASKGTMALAKAGNIEFADAAVIAASALNAFSMEGKDASKVADMLAAGANASQADLTDLAQGLQQSATVAKQFRLSLDENVTALALFANNGIRGSDAGTSLKTMLISLARPSDGAVSAMKEIGFSAYNAKGEFVGLREMGDRLQKSLKGLTDEQKQQTLATIFGTDAFRAAAVLSDNAGDSYDKMSKAVNNAGAAQKAAAAQLGPYERSMEGLKNTASELSLRIGSKLTPAVTTAANFVSKNAVPAFDTLTDIMTGQVPIVSGMAVGVGAYASVVGGITVATKGWALAQGALNLVMKANPVGLVVSAVAGLASATIFAANQTNSSTTATQRLTEARNGLKQATDSARDAENQLKDAQLSAEGAALAVERAQKTYNDAVRQFGPDSLEAREAAHQLKRAQDDHAKALDGVAKKQQEVKQKNDEIVKQKEIVKTALREMKDSANDSAGGFRNLAGTLEQVANKQQTVKAGTANGSPTPLGLSQMGIKLPGHAIGTNYAAGGWTKVGEHGEELVNLPRGAQVIPHYQTRQMLQDGGGGTTVNIYGNITNETPEAAEAFWSRVDQSQRLAARGMA
ncbi:phage tail tape measure protein [Mycobacteroides abscessus]|uniref:phage tail tape measure protein n=1 Tax=Mycobacteroides abscessus TaxID=36809 RepID=UPI000C269FDD|nr:phage tail tape measure protein [Mycobacteroides abscessus]